MAFHIDWSERLQNYRVALSDLTQVNNPGEWEKKLGTLDFLLNPAFNPRTIQVFQNEQANNFKYRTVQIKYEPHWGDENLVTDDASASCDAVDQRRSYLNTYDADLYTEYKFTLEHNYLRQNLEDGESFDQYMQQSIRRAQIQARQHMNRNVLTSLAAVFGANPAQGTLAGVYNNVQVINSNGGVDISTFDDIMNDMEDNFMSGMPGMIGLGNARRLKNRLGVAAIQTNDGVAIGELDPAYPTLFKDHYASSVLGNDNRVLVLYPGLTQFFSYSLYASPVPQVQPTGTTIYGQMPDTRYPFMWDYILRWDDKCTTDNGHQGAWTMRLFKYYNIFTVPEAAFGDTYGDLNDFNGIVGYNLTNA